MFSRKSRKSRKSRRRSIIRRSSSRRKSKSRRSITSRLRDTLSLYTHTKQKSSLQRDFEYSIEPYVNFEPNVSIAIYPTQFANINV